MIVIASGKGGVGKSTLSANLGIALGRMKQRVCIFDADTNLANINILFGLSPEYTLADYVSGEKRLKQILLPVADQLQIVPAASGIAEFIDLDQQHQERLLSGLQEIEQDHDLILIDSAAGIGSSQLSFFLAASYAILVITPEPTSLTDAFSFLKVAKRYGFDRTVYILVNMASDLHAARTAFKRFKNATEQYLQLNVGYLGYVLQDPYVPESIRKQTPVMLYKPECLASRCIRAITERLVRLLQNEKKDPATLSRYLSEMNQPFGIDIRSADEQEGATSETSETDAHWQQRILAQLGQMERSDAEEFLRRAIREWSIRHDTEEADLIRDASSPGIDVITPLRPESIDEKKVASLAVPKNGHSNEPTQPDLSLRQFQDSITKTPYGAAIQFADLLARIEQG